MPRLTAKDLRPPADVRPAWLRSVERDRARDRRARKFATRQQTAVARVR